MKENKTIKDATIKDATIKDKTIKDKTIEDKTIEDKKKELIQKYYDDEQLLKEASEEEKQQYRSCVEEGVKKEWEIALYAMAYGCYGGNEIFDCDWEKSRDCLLKLIEQKGDEDPFLYNTLGYIYYYGRCNQGVGEYEKAFQYFSVGSANGVFESMYKTADMYIQGKGVPKSEKAGAKILLGMYNENMEIFCNDNADCKFADVALRVGGLFEYGIGVEQDDGKAYYHYLEAKYAITLRRQKLDYYGDEKVANSIQTSLERVKSRLPEDYFTDTFVLDHPAMAGLLLSDSVGLDVELSYENGSYYLYANRYASEDMPEKSLINIPTIGYCSLTNSIRLKLRGLSEIENYDLPQKAFIDEIMQGQEEHSWIFTYRDMPMLEFTCEEFVFEKEI